MRPQLLQEPQEHPSRGAYVVPAVAAACLSAVTIAARRHRRNTTAPADLERAAAEARDAEELAAIDADAQRRTRKRLLDQIAAEYASYPLRRVGAASDRAAA